jgi:hypothetical protein
VREPFFHTSLSLAMGIHHRNFIGFGMSKT